MKSLYFLLVTVVLLCVTCSGKHVDKNNQKQKSSRNQDPNIEPKDDPANTEYNIGIGLPGNGGIGIGEQGAGIGIPGLGGIGITDGGIGIGIPGVGGIGIGDEGIGIGIPGIGIIGIPGSPRQGNDKLRMSNKAASGKNKSGTLKEAKEGISQEHHER